jgi:hypothetical protein
LNSQRETSEGLQLEQRQQQLLLLLLLLQPRIQPLPDRGLQLVMLINPHRVSLKNLLPVLEDLHLVGPKGHLLVLKNLQVGHLKDDLHQGSHHQTRESPLLASKGLLQEV